MKINPSIFKSYDIRGIYPSELNEEAAFEIGKAFIIHTGAKKVAIGHDARISSPALFKALVRGISAQGAEIYDIGQVPTECLYFAVGNYDFDAGAMITASHNPKEYGGIKMVQKNGKAVTILRGVDLMAAVEKNSQAEAVEPSFDEEKIKRMDIWKDYINHILSFVDLSEIMPMKIVIDASNGVEGHVISRIQDKLPVEMIPLNFEPDGNFPNHSPNPLLEGSADQVGKKIIEEKADFGFIFDADADRIFLVDENGKFVSADLTLILIAKYFLKNNPGLAVSYNVVCSRAVPKFIKEYGGKPVRTKVGFVFVQKGMMDNDGIMGGELSGHYCFRDNFYLDSGGIALLALLQLISGSGKKVSELISEINIYCNEPAIEFKTDKAAQIIERLKEKYSDGAQDELDGITVEYDNWWFNVRSSNTEPIMRLTIEADTQKLLQEKRKELVAFIGY